GSFYALSELLVAEESLVVVLDRVVALACGAIGSCDAASVTYMMSEKPLTIACTNPIAQEIDDAQYAENDGPCLTAFRERRLVSVASMTEGDSWPLFRAAAIRRDVRSSLSLPLATGHVKVGALNLYGHADHAFNAVAPEPALLFAAQATAAVW